MRPTQSLSIILAVGLTLSAVGTVAQEKSRDQCECAIIDGKSGAQFITYDGFSEATSEVKLRIHNNTTCAIVIETDNGPATIFRSLPGGGHKLETVKGSADGALIHAHYLMHERMRWPKFIQPYDWGDVVSEYEVPGGQTAVFYVPVSKFKAGYDIAIPFDYKWDHDRSLPAEQGAVNHIVNFLRENIPNTILGKSR